MLILPDELLDWFREKTPDPTRDPRGGRPAVDKRRTISGIFLMLYNGAKWKVLWAPWGIT